MKTAAFRFLIAIPILYFLYLGCGGSAVSGPDASINLDQVKIMGTVTNAEGMGVPDLEITFHSEPVVVQTDAEGNFSAVLAVGDHTFDILTADLTSYTGAVTVTASELVDEAGGALGTFVASLDEAASDMTCGALQFVDSVAGQGASTVFGTIEGGLGNEIASQGLNPTVLIVGNAEITANFTKDGRLNALWFPSVGAYNHLPYLSMSADWMKPFQGSFGGLRAQGTYYWFDDPAYWSVDVKYEASSLLKSAPVAEITYSGLGACTGTTVVEKAFVPWDSYVSGADRSNTLIRDFQVQAGNLCGGASDSNTRFVMYSRFNLNANNPFFRQWIRDDQTTACSADSLTWTRTGTPSYSIALSAMDSGKGALAMTCDSEIASIEEAKRLYPSTSCNPTSVKPGLAEWKVPADGRVTTMIATCENPTICQAALANARASGADALKTATLNTWYEYLQSSNRAEDGHAELYLMTLRMLADRRTGAMIAAPSHEPTYYFSWPRDGVFQAVAHIMAGHEEIADKFFSDFLFGLAERQNGKWVQAYSSLTGKPLNFLSYSFLEEDQMPTVLWGVWVYWKRTGSRPSGVSATQIVEVADYVVGRICSDGLISPSLDWHENPLKDIGQSLYTNAAAHAGLIAAAEMIESSDPSKADAYRDAAALIKEAVATQLCGSGDCHARRKYGADAYDIAQLVTACSVSGSPEFSDDAGELTMAFAMPFNLFSLEDPLVQSFYERTYATHSSMDSFSPADPLFVPRYLYSALYASRAVHPEFGAQDDSYRTSILIDPYVFRGGMYDASTPVDYLKDEHWGDSTNDPEDQGGSARPLGWSQAMGALVDLEQGGFHLPLIGAPDPGLLSSFQEDFASGFSKWTLVSADNSGPIPADQLPTIYTFSGMPKPSYDNGEIGACRIGAYTKDAFDYSEGMSISADIYIQSSGTATFGILKSHPEADYQGTKGCYEDYGIYMSYAPLSISFGYSKDNLYSYHTSISGSYPAGAWHNFKIEITPTRTVNFYIDNILKQAISGPLSERFIGNPIGLGGDSPSPARVLIDNVKVWK